MCAYFLPIVQAKICWIWVAAILCTRHHLESEAVPLQQSLGMDFPHMSWPAQLDAGSAVIHNLSHECIKLPEMTETYVLSETTDKDGFMT